MAIINENIEEIQKLVKYIEQMENILRTSSNTTQIDRVRKEIHKFRSRLNSLAPVLDAERGSIDEIKNRLSPHLSEAKDNGAAAAQTPDEGLRDPRNRQDLRGRSRINVGTDLIDRFPINRASPNSTDPETNFLSTMLLLIDGEYWPVLSDQHCKLDFSHSGVRDTARKKLDGALTNLKILAETIEEYATAENQDFREQLLKMKNKQSRIFLMETNEVFKELIGFLAELIDDINKNGTVIHNKKDLIRFNPRFEKATLLEGKTLEFAITEFEMMLNQIVKKLNLPSMK